MTTSLLLENVAAYASQVRACLRDLGPEQVDELTGGLEADLAEAIEDPNGRPITGEIPITSPADSSASTSGSGEVPEDKTVIDLELKFGTPKAYADELRSAAGLPLADPSSTGEDGAPGRGMRGAARLQEGMRRVDSALGFAGWDELRAAFHAAQPLWSSLLIWTLAAGALGIFFGADPFLAVALGLGLFTIVSVLSIRYYRGTWVPQRGLPHASRYLNVLAVVALLPLLGSASSASPTVEYVYLDNEYYDDEILGTNAAIYVGGSRATNLFVYGPDGEFIDGARVIDQDGRPLQLTPNGSLFDPDMDVSMFWEPRVDATGADAWNAFPLGFWTSRMANWDEETEKWVLPEGVNIRPQVPPIAKLTALEPAPTESPAEKEGAADATSGSIPGESDNAKPGKVKPDDSEEDHIESTKNETPAPQPKK